MHTRTPANTLNPHDYTCIHQYSHSCTHYPLPTYQPISTHTHTHTYARTHTHTHTHTLALTHAQTHTHTRKLTRALTLTQSLSLLLHHCIILLTPRAMYPSGPYCQDVPKDTPYQPGPEQRTNAAHSRRSFNILHENVEWHCKANVQRQQQFID